MPLSDAPITNIVALSAIRLLAAAASSAAAAFFHANATRTKHCAPHNNLGL